jgi:hypothetical protein
MKAGGADEPIASIARAPPARSSNDIQGRRRLPVSTGGAGFAATGGAALIFRGGGGQVISPSLITVSPRMTSSSIFTKASPFFSGVSSVNSCRRLVA